jgi:hypothetical protein
MVQALRAVGDSLLQRLVPGVTAGACVPENGHVCCACCFVGNTHYCFRINCIGHCVIDTSTCC